MTTPPLDGWPSPQPWDSTPDDQGQPYGQPFDPEVSSPTQQPPPPGWEQGTWTHHGDTTPSANNGQWLLIGIGVLVIVIVAAAVIFLVA